MPRSLASAIRRVASSGSWSCRSARSRRSGRGASRAPARRSRRPDGRRGTRPPPRSARRRRRSSARDPTGVRLAATRSASGPVPTTMTLCSARPLACARRSAARTAARPAIDQHRPEDECVHGDGPAGEQRQAQVEVVGEDERRDADADAAHHPRQLGEAPPALAGRVQPAGGEDQGPGRRGDGHDRGELAERRELGPGVLRRRRRARGTPRCRRRRARGRRRRR